MPERTTSVKFGVAEGNMIQNLTEGIALPPFNPPKKLELLILQGDFLFENTEIACVWCLICSKRVLWGDNCLCKTNL